MGSGKAAGSGAWPEESRRSSHQFWPRRSSGVHPPRRASSRSTPSTTTHPPPARPENRARRGEASGCSGRGPSRSPRSASGCRPPPWAGRTGWRIGQREPWPPPSGRPASPWPWGVRRWSWISWSNPCFSCGRIYNNDSPRVNAPLLCTHDPRRRAHATDEGAGEDAGAGTGGARRHRRRRDAAPGAGVSRAGGRQALLRLGPEGPQGPQRAQKSAPGHDRRPLLRRLVSHHRGDGAGARARDRARAAVPAAAAATLREVSAVLARGRARRLRLRHRGADADARVFLVILTPRPCNSSSSRASKERQSGHRRRIPFARRPPRLACGLPENFSDDRHITPTREGKERRNAEGSEESGRVDGRIAGAARDRRAGGCGRRHEGAGRRRAGRERREAGRSGPRGHREGHRQDGGRWRGECGRQDQGGGTGSGARGQVGLEQDQGRGRVLRPQREELLHEPVRIGRQSDPHNQLNAERGVQLMKTTRVMSLVTAAVFALGMAGSALAQTPTTPAPSTTPAPNAPAKGDSMDKMDKKDGKGATKHTAKKKHAVKKSEDATKAPDTKAPEQPKK